MLSFYFNSPPTRWLGQPTEWQSSEIEIKKIRWICENDLSSSVGTYFGHLLPYFWVIRIYSILYSIRLLRYLVWHELNQKLGPGRRTNCIRCSNSDDWNHTEGDSFSMLHCTTNCCCFFFIFFIWVKIQNTTTTKIDNFNYNEASW